MRVSTQTPMFFKGLHYRRREAVEPLIKTLRYKRRMGNLAPSLGKQKDKSYETNKNQMSSKAHAPVSGRTKGGHKQ